MVKPIHVRHPASPELTLCGLHKFRNPGTKIMQGLKTTTCPKCLELAAKVRVARAERTPEEREAYYKTQWQNRRARYGT